MKSNDKNIGLIVVLTMLMMTMVITSSTILFLKFNGKEKLMYTLDSLGIIKNMKQKKYLREEIEQFPYLTVFHKEEKNVFSGLDHEEKILYYKIKKYSYLNGGEIKAVIDLMKELNFRYDYFICAQSNRSYDSLISTEYMYSVIYDKYKSLIDMYLKGSSSDYKEMYIRGIYFHYLSNIYKDDLQRILIEYNMEPYDVKEYFRRNNTFSSQFYLDFVENIDMYKDIYRYYLKTII
ncbi:hypothetical protein [Tepidibacter thalassicus]|uniref:Uncharacterized protein n=1 Tax=Tepidibacter thalassicus DSM 15285 TaxID=1123350 RepID=A0A1M5TAJ1_9FIRM|nr:hypothetical protein [Tepidibacter thalassicus]SHH47698.1 hypothetical protein SAMN02744040_02086 [Tepidibacter thalassicus DSM 15285]